MDDEQLLIEVGKGLRSSGRSKESVEQWLDRALAGDRLHMLLACRQGLAEAYGGSFLMQKSWECLRETRRRQHLIRAVERARIRTQFPTEEQVQGHWFDVHRRGENRWYVHDPEGCWWRLEPKGGGPHRNLWKIEQVEK